MLKKIYIFQIHFTILEVQYTNKMYFNIQLIRVIFQIQYKIPNFAKKYLNNN